MTDLECELFGVEDPLKTCRVSLIFRLLISSALQCHELSRCLGSGMTDKRVILLLDLVIWECREMKMFFSFFKL